MTFGGKPRSGEVRQGSGWGVGFALLALAVPSLAFIACGGDTESRHSELQDGGAGGVGGSHGGASGNAGDAGEGGTTNTSSVGGSSDEGVGGAGAGGVITAMEGWEFCVTDAQSTSGETDVTIHLTDEVWCSSLYVLPAFPEESQPLTNSLLARAQARAIAGAYGTSSDSEQLTLPLCAKMRSGEGVSSDAGTLEMTASGAMQTLSIALGSDVVEISVGLRGSNNGPFEGPTSIEIVPQTRTIRLSPCQGIEEEALWGMEKFYGFAGGEVTFEVLVSAPNSYEISSETLVAARGTIGDVSFEQTDFFSLAGYGSLADGPMNGMGVVFDTPVGEVCGLSVEAASLYATDCELRPLYELTIEAQTSETTPL